MELILPRRGFIFGLVGLFAAPAVIKASSLMPIKGEAWEDVFCFYWQRDIDAMRWTPLVHEAWIPKGSGDLYAPPMKRPGTYVWSGFHGEERGARVLAGGLVIPDSPVARAR